MIETTFLPQITGEDIPTRKVGKSVYRWLAPMSKVLEHPDAKKLWENEGAGFVTFHNERGLMFVTYPCRNGELLNCAVFHDTRPDERDKDDWNAGTKHERVLEVMEGCADVVKHIPMYVPFSAYSNHFASLRTLPRNVIFKLTMATGQPKKSKSTP